LDVHHSKRAAAADETEKALDKIPWKEMLPWLVGTFIVVGSCYLRPPSGLSAAAQSLVEFLKAAIAAVLFHSAHCW